MEIVGAYSRTPENLKQFAEEKGIKPFHNLQKLIDKFDILHLCTPPVNHEDLTVQILRKDKDVIVEEPLTGYFGSGEDDFSGDTFSREKGLKHALQSAKKILEAERDQAKVRLCTPKTGSMHPPYKKEREAIEKTKAQILWIQAQQSHAGSHSSNYGKWKLSGGGSLMGKGFHPLAGAVYL